MNKTVLKKFMGGMAKDAAFGILKGIGVLVILAIMSAMVLAICVALVWIPGFISAITWNVVHGGDIGFGEDCIGLGFLSLVPILITLIVIEAVLEIKKWISVRWALASGGRKIRSYWSTGYKPGDSVWIGNDGEIFPVKIGVNYEEFKVFSVDKTERSLVAIPITQQEERK